MTTRALVRHNAFDYDRVRATLRERVVADRVDVGGHPVRVTPEPLFQHATGGGLLQSVRIDIDGPTPAEPHRVTAHTEGGSALPVRLLPLTGGVRVLVPAVDAATTVLLRFPDLAPDDAIAVALEPQRRWTIHLVHHSHLDIGYTDPQGTVLQEHRSYLDSCLDLIDETDDWPDAARFRWAVESLWSFDQWSRGRPPARVAEFVRRVREGRIELTAMPFNLHTETCSTDELHELLRLAGDVRAEHGVRITTAMQTDVPGAVAGLVDVLDQAGVRYLSVAHNWAGRSVARTLTGGPGAPRTVRAGGAPGRRETRPAGLPVTDTPHGMAYMEGPMLGFDRSYELVDEHLPAYLTSLATNPYPYDGSLFGFAAADVPLDREPYPWDVLHMRVQGRFADNAPPRRIMSETVRRWNETWAHPTLRLSRNEDFFVEAEGRFGDRVPTFEGDWNDWWAEGVGSGARPLQLVRRAQGVVADAQTVSSLAGTLGSAEAAGDTAQARQVYLSAALFDEHTWGASDPWTHGDDHHHSGDQQWHWKYGTALSAHDGAYGLLGQATARFGHGMGTGPGALASMHVVNTCSWPRTDVFTGFLPESRVPLDRAVAVVDARTGRTLPFDEIPQRNPDHREAGRFLRLVLDAVPPLGTVRLDIVDAAGAAAAVGAPTGDTSGTDPVLENEHLRVRVDLATASIFSIVDKSTGRELVNVAADFGFNSYIYDRYASAGGLNHQSSRLEDDHRLRLLGDRSVARPAALISNERGATGSRLVYESGAAGVDWIRTTLTLPAGVARLDIENRLAKPATMSKESAFFAFPFALTDPVVRVEATGGVVGTGIPAVPGGAAHMRAIRRWVSLHQDGFGVAWSTQDAPLIQLAEIAVPYPPFPPSTPHHEPATVYSWLHNNIWDALAPASRGFEGDLHAAGVATGRAISARPAPAVLRACGPPLARQPTPLHAVRAAARRRPWPAEGTCSRRGRRLDLDDHRVRVVGLTTPAPGQVLVRLQSVADQEVPVTLRPHWPIGSARRATFLGAPADSLDITAGGVTVTVARHGTIGVLLQA
ncbi:hypothetical protein [Plantactinospora sp. CA-290183]|uniref:glycoside hydrolase family 38 N-terminal domain-containing protein n=1 Tax=Plantactinospora sp. CA-290183 TaxID=3240006 RepID=UPI003D90DB22